MAAVGVERSAEVLGDLFDVRDLRVVVTGAAGGLGLAMAEVLGECGARVTLADIDAEVLEEATRDLQARGVAARSFVADVTDEGRVQALIDDVVSAEGSIDVVIANAGLAATSGFGTEGGQTLDTIEPADWDHVLAVNLTGVMHTMKAGAAAMKRQGTGGRIVVISSIAGLRAEPVVCYGYVAAKAAVVNMIRQAALELAPYDVLVNVICPGPFKGTRIGGGRTLDPDPETEQMWTSFIPLKRMASPEELKGLTLLLSSPAGSFITGSVFVVDGGAAIK